MFAGRKLYVCAWWIAYHADFFVRAVNERCARRQSEKRENQQKVFHALDAALFKSSRK